MKKIRDSNQYEYDAKNRFDRLLVEDAENEPQISNDIKNRYPRIPRGPEWSVYIGLLATQNKHSRDRRCIEQAGCKHDAVGQQIEDGSLLEIIRVVD